MCSDTNQATHGTTARGERLRSNCGHPRDFPPSTSMQRPATTPRTSNRGRLTVFLIVFFLAAMGVFFAAGASAQQQAAPISPSQQPPAPTAPPQDIPQGSYKIKSQVNLVVLHVSVLNDRSVFVPGLMEDSFRFLEKRGSKSFSCSSKRTCRSVLAWWWTIAAA